MVEKCSKCSNELPKDAKYCLNCGAKVAKESQLINEQIHPLFQSLFSKNLIVAALLLGMLFIWIGVIISTYNTEVTGWRAAQTMNSLGFFIVGVFLIGGGIVNDHLDKYVRLGMIVIGVYMITAVLSITSLLSNINSLIPY